MAASFVLLRLDDHSNDMFSPARARSFDFTTILEQSILSIFLSALLLLAAPFRLFHLSRRRAVTVHHRIFAFKAVAAVCNTALQLALAVLWSSSPAIQTRTSVPSVVLSFLSSVTILCLSYLEARRSVRPSSLLVVYLFFATIFDAIQARTFWSTHHTALAATQSATVGVKFVMLCLEESSKTSYLKQPYKDYPPEATSGILNKSFVWWLNKLFVTGYQKLISDHDLFNIDPALESGHIGERLQSMWDKRAKPEGKYELPKTVVYFLKWNLLGIIFPRLCMIGFTFAQPFLISAIINYVNESTGREDSKHAYSLISATFLIYFGITMSTVHYKQRFDRIVTTFRGAMISLLYNRTLTLQDGVVAESAVLTLMSTDVDSIINHLENINDLWARSLEIVIGIWLLARQVGWICVVPLAVGLLCAFGQAQVAKTLGKNQQKWNKAIQKRVKNTSSMLSSMKPVKISGLATNIASELQGEREQELKTSRAFYKGILFLNMLSNLPAIWSPVLAFIIFAVQAKIRGTDPLTTVQAFTSLSIITLVTSPVARLLSLLARVSAAQGCFERLQAYLTSQSREDTRLEVGEPRANPLLSLDPDEGKGPGESDSSHTHGGYSKSPIAVAFEDSTILPAPNATIAAVKNASFTVQTGSLTILVGPVGSGKTVLLKAILGELPCSSGRVSVSSKDMSFCKQTSWILNISVKDGICGPPDLEVDEEWYSTVVHACALEEDMKQWPEGDRTIVGSKGLTLSGGQKQRISLARCVYARKDIVLLDDIQSALDTRMQDIINTRLLSQEGLLKRLGSTVILATHSVGCLHLADKVIVLDSEGKVVRETSNKEDFTDPATIKVVEAADDQHQEERHHTGQETGEPGADKLMDLARRSGDLSIYSYYFRTIGLPLLTAFLVTYMIQAFAMHFPQILIKWWTAANGEHLPEYLSAYAAFALATTFLLGYGIWITFLKIMPLAAVRLHKILLDTVMSAPLSFFASTDTGITLNRFSQDMSLVDLPLPGSLLVFTSTFFDCLASLAFIASGSSYMAVTIPFTLIAIYGIQNIYLKTSRQLRYLDIENKSPIYSHFLETLDGLVTIRAFGWQRTVGETQVRHLDNSQRAYYMLLCAQRWLNVVLDLVVTVLAVIVVALAVGLRGSTSAGLIGVALNNILGFNQSLSGVVSSWASLETSLGAIARVKSFAETTPREERPDNEYVPSQEWPEKGAVQMDSVSAVYGETTLALQNISMEITPGQKIGICGRTGSGKSSLILALLHLIETSEGGITIDGIDISTIPRDILRQRLVAIPQDPFILPGSVRANADPLCLASDDAIVSALKKINIWAALENRGGLDAIMQDQPLSQGQEQLFCLARAMLRKSKVLILDEATSSVDGETDRVMQKVIREEFGGCTIITVAHRLETIIDADKIAVLDAGKLVEFDSPESLLARDSVFRRMRGS